MSQAAILLLNQARAHIAERRIELGLQAYVQAVQADPDNLELAIEVARVANQVGHAPLAAEALALAADIAPNDVRIALDRAHALINSGQAAPALEAAQVAVQLAPAEAEAYYVLGRAHRIAGDLEAAITAYRRAVELRPQYADAHNNLGVALAMLGRMPEAVEVWQALIQYQPDHVETYANLGRAFAEISRHDAALHYYGMAAKLRPNAENVERYASVLARIDRVDEALAAYQEALRLLPNAAPTLNQLALLHVKRGEIDVALAIYRKAIAQDPRNHALHSNMLMAMHYDISMEPAAFLKAHQVWAARHAAGITPYRDWPNDRSPDRRLRVGYVSGDFLAHPVANFIEPILAHHNRDRIDVTCYSTNAVTDSVTDRLRTYGHTWKEVPQLPDDQFAELVRQDQIDILVDLSGHTGSHRLLAFARKPAPVQVTFMGYSDTTGLTAIDYLLTDAVADPPGEPNRYTETLVRLPLGFSCYRPQDNAPEVNELPAAGGRGVTFGTLHGLNKINAKTIATWAAVLHAVADSRLMVCRYGLKGGPAERLADEFARAGAPMDRVQLLGEFDPLRFLDLYHQIDIALDVFPWSGHTTSCEAMWMGVPVITLAGRTHVGRMVASVLTQVGLADLIAATPEQYVELARALAGDLTRLAEIRRTLRPRMAASPLGDGVKFTAALEDTYRWMWGQYLARTV